MTRNPTYYDGDLAADLIAESVRVIEADGAAAVSLRAIGRTLGVSNAAPKNHFPNKAALFAAIAIEGFAALTEVVNAASEGTANDPPVVAAGVAYVDFALSHPGHFAVMWQPELHDDPDDVVAAKTESFASLLRLIGDADDPEAVDLTNLAWAFAHGLATLLLSGSLTPPRNLSARDYVARQLQSLYDVTPRFR